MLISFAFWRKVPTARFSGAVFLMVFGAIVAGVGDAQFSSDGCVVHACSADKFAVVIVVCTCYCCTARYLFALGSCFAQASYLLYVQNTSGAKADLDAHGAYVYFHLHLLLCLTCLWSRCRASVPPSSHLSACSCGWRRDV